MATPIAICALLVAIASLPPVWPRVSDLLDEAGAMLRHAALGLADADEPQSTGALSPPHPLDQGRGRLLPPPSRPMTFPSGLASTEPLSSSSSIEGRDAALPARVDALQRSLDAVRRSVETLDQAVERMRTSERRLALTLILQSATRDGRPFVAELEWLRRSASDEVTAAAVDVLLPYARRGVATVADLRDALYQSELSDAVRRAAVSETSYLDRMQRGVTGWIADFGMTQKPKPLDVDAILDEARLAIARGLIAEATAAIQRLEGPPATLMAPWVARAKTRLLIDEMVQRLMQSSAGPG